MSMPWALSLERVTLSAVLPTESKTPMLSSTDQSTRIPTNATIAMHTESRNDSFITDHGSTRASTNRARRGLPGPAAGARRGVLTSDGTGGIVAVGWPPPHGSRPGAFELLTRLSP